MAMDEERKYVCKEKEIIAIYVERGNMNAMDEERKQGMRVN